MSFLQTFATTTTAATGITAATTVVAVVRKILSSMLNYSAKKAERNQSRHLDWACSNSWHRGQRICQTTMAVGFPGTDYSLDSCILAGYPSAGSLLARVLVARLLAAKVYFP